ncbi:MAG: hypothetical protein FWC47_09275, partial [Oscillospiraceae bacterium]|nr:hypothetical protein [Oscillospiraceae bacterium]
MSNKIIKLEYGENEFMEFEIKSSLISEYKEEALGGTSVIEDFALNTYEKSIEKMTNFLKCTSKEIKEDLGDVEYDGVTISLGFSLSAEGNFVVASSSAEASLGVEVTFKGRDYGKL